MFFVSCVSHAFVSVHCCLLVTRWEWADLLALVGDVYCMFGTFPCGVLGCILKFDSWCLILLFPDLCRLSYFEILMLVFVMVIMKRLSFSGNYLFPLTKL